MITDENILKWANSFQMLPSYIWELLAKKEQELAMIFKK